MLIFVRLCYALDACVPAQKPQSTRCSRDSFWAVIRSGNGSRRQPPKSAEEGRPRPSGHLTSRRNALAGQSYRPCAAPGAAKHRTRGLVDARAPTSPPRLAARHQAQAPGRIHFLEFSVHYFTCLLLYHFRLNSLEMRLNGRLTVTHTKSGNRATMYLSKMLALGRKRG